MTRMIYILLAFTILLLGNCISHYTTTRFLPAKQSEHLISLDAIRTHNNNSPAYTYRFHYGFNERMEMHLGIQTFDVTCGYKLKLLEYLALYHTVLRAPIDGVGVNPGFDIALITGVGPIYGGAGFARFWTIGKNKGQNIVPNRALYGVFIGAELSLTSTFRIYPELTLDLTSTSSPTGSFGIAAGFGASSTKQSIPSK